MLNALKIEPSGKNTLVEIPDYSEYISALGWNMGADIIYFDTDCGKFCCCVDDLGLYRKDALINPLAMDICAYPSPLVGVALIFKVGYDDFVEMDNDDARSVLGFVPPTC